MWKTVKLGDVCEVLDKLRKPITKKDRSSGEIPYYGATGIVDWVADYIFDEKLVLVGEDGAKWDAGDKTAFIIEGKSWVNNHAHVLRPISSLVTHEWLAYYLTSINLMQWVTGLTVPKLNQAQLRSIPIPLPPLAEQQRIVAKLDAAFAEIDKAIGIANAKGIEIEKLKSSLLANELCMRESDNAITWKTVKLGDVCEIQPPKKEVLHTLADDAEVSFMGMNLLGIDKVEAKTVEVRSLSAVYKAYTYFAENDVLLAKITPCFENGKLGLAKGLKNGVGFGSSEFIVFRCKETLEPKFLYHFLNQKSFREEGKRNMSGAVGHKRVTKEFITNTLLPLPPLAEQQRIVAKLDAAFDELETAKLAVQRTKANYTSLKSAILAQELKGETA